MTRPLYKIEIYDNTPALVYTIGEGGTADLLRVRTVHSMTDRIGSFNFSLSSKAGTEYLYDDVDVHYKVKIFLGYDSLSGSDLVMAGRITDIESLVTEAGYVRMFNGLDLGELLQRRMKTKYWYNVDAHTIVDELANTDLGLAVDTDSDTHDETIYADTERYFDLFKKASDYFVDGVNDVKKDFYIADVAGVDTLRWKARPIRTSGVETLTVGKNIQSLRVIRDVNRVKNWIVVYGARDLAEPSDKDSWTEGIGDWTLAQGSPPLVADAVDFAVGTASVRGDSNFAVNPPLEFYYGPTTDVFTGPRKDGNTTIHFWAKSEGLAALILPSVSILYQWTPHVGWSRTLGDVWTNNQWNEFTFPVGPDAEGWTALAHPNNKNYWNLPVLMVDFESVGSGNGVHSLHVDGLHFGNRCFYCAAEQDAGSQTDYGRRDLYYVDSNLVSNAECLNMAKTLLYQLSQPLVQIEAGISGNTNVKIGDRLNMTVPAEDMSAVPFDVIQVEHDFSAQGFTTKALMVNSVNVRKESDFTTPMTSIKRLLQAQKLMAKDQKEIG
jgi:hypothetical protein